LLDKNGANGPTTIYLGQSAGLEPAPNPNLNLNLIGIGQTAGAYRQINRSMAIGLRAGWGDQGSTWSSRSSSLGEAIAIGTEAGYDTQRARAIAIGSQAGYYRQDGGAVAIGSGAGYLGQGEFSVAIGSAAGYDQQYANSIVLNATGNNLNASTSSFYVKPIRSNTTTNILYYNTSTGEITYGSGGGGGSTGTATWATLGDKNNGYGPTTIALGYLAGYGYGGQGVNAIAVGALAGYIGQGDYAVAIGDGAGQDYQEDYAVAIGSAAGIYQGTCSVAIGAAAGTGHQAAYSIAIGTSAGTSGQAGDSIAIGTSAGYNDQGSQSIAIGYAAGAFQLGKYSIAIGNLASQHTGTTSTIVLNASGYELGAPIKNSFVVKPIRQVVTATNTVYYNTSTGEITHSTFPRLPNYASDAAATAAASTAYPGMMYYDTTNNQAKVWDGSSWSRMN
jgi:hypothetical protein